MNYFTSLYSAHRIDRRLWLLSSVIAVTCLIYLLSEAYYILRLTAIHKNDMSLYYRTAARIMEGQIPFKDFRLEYPVFAIFPIIIPAIINLLFGSSFESYCILFCLQNIIFGIVAARFLAKIPITESNTTSRQPVYWVLIIFSLPIYLFRYDPFLAILTMMVIYAMITRPYLAGVVLMLAIEAKLYPIIFLPILVLFYLINKDYQKMTAFFVGSVVTLLFTLLIVLPLTGISFFDFLAYHQQRGIQLESIVAGLLLVLNQFDLVDLRLTNSFGSFNIDTEWSRMILNTIGVITPIVFILVISFLARAFMSEKRMYGSIRAITLIRALGAITLVFLVLNKVMSPQYVIWLFPFIPFYENPIRIKFIIVVMLTISIYPGWYHYLQNFHPVMVIMVNLRTILIVWMLVDLLKSVGSAKNHITPKPIGDL